MLLAYAIEDAAECLLCKWKGRTDRVFKHLAETHDRTVVSREEGPKYKSDDRPRWRWVGPGWKSEEAFRDGQ